MNVRTQVIQVRLGPNIYIDVLKLLVLTSYTYGTYVYTYVYKIELGNITILSFIMILTL